ncbi:MAG TPA: hypothetical protein VK174_18590 [Chitinophagales bacterium]|nr:hypothetical protein [Chitinophagales bacterium]
MMRFFFVLCFFAAIQFLSAQQIDSAALERIEELTNALKGDSQYYCSIRFDRAVDYRSISEHEKAVLDLNYYIDNCGAMKMAYNLRAESNRKLKKYKESLVDYQKAYDLAYDGKGGIMFEIGFCYAQLEKTDSAIISYTKAIELDDTQDICYYNRGLLLINKGRNDEGCADLKKAMTLGLANAKYPYTDFCK